MDGRQAARLAQLNGEEIADPEEFRLGFGADGGGGGEGTGFALGFQVAEQPGHADDAHGAAGPARTVRLAPDDVRLVGANGVRNLFQLLAGLDEVHFDQLGEQVFFAAGEIKQAFHVHGQFRVAWGGGLGFVV